MKLQTATIVIAAALATLATRAARCEEVGQSMARDPHAGSAPVEGRRIAYGSDSLQFGELRLPEGPGPHPVAIVIHGGCWYAEYGLSYMQRLCVALARAGVATWSIEYRRIGDAGGGWPGTFLDVAHAADSLRGIAHGAPLDLRRVVAVGHSAGGQLGLWLASRSRLPQGNPLYVADPLPLRGVISLAGITDMERFGPRCDGAAAKLLGGPPDAVASRYALVSPVRLLPIGVPQRLLHGERDTIVPLEMARQYEAEARGRGDTIQLEVLEGAGHFELVTPRSKAWPAVEAAVLSLLGPPAPK